MIYMYLLPNDLSTGLLLILGSVIDLAGLIPVYHNQCSQTTSQMYVSDVYTIGDDDDIWGTVYETVKWTYELDWKIIF